MNRDAGDILDRYSIAVLKTERIKTEENKKERKAFAKEFNKLIKKHPKYKWEQLFNYMKDINDFIWQLEAGLKSGKEALKNPHYILDSANKKALANIGATTIIIRNFNSLRVNFKNIINHLVKEGFQDIKKEHLSENSFDKTK